MKETILDNMIKRAAGNTQGQFTKKDFGENFSWGVSTAAYQIEGAHNADGKGPLEKYNETVKVAFLKAVYHAKLESETDNFQDFISQGQALKKPF